MYNLLSLLFLYRVRFHYGHPDVFDRLFHLTRGGVSKASKVINLSEDIFAGKVMSNSSVFALWLMSSAYEFYYVICRL